MDKDTIKRLLDEDKVLLQDLRREVIMLPGRPADPALRLAYDIGRLSMVADILSVYEGETET